MGLDHLLCKLDGFREFAERHRHTPACPEPLGNHQLVPIYDAIENGLRRFVLVYATSAGKTLIPTEIVRHLRRKGESAKTLVIAPKQTLPDGWGEEVFRSDGSTPAVLMINGRDDIMDKEGGLVIPKATEIVTVNYDKLQERFCYLEPIVNFAKDADVIIADEFHNAKCHRGKVSRGYQRIIDASKNARFIGLSATPAFDTLTDLGMMLYAIDPNRFGHYRNIPYHVNDDPEALWEMRENGNVRFFDNDAVARFHQLPPFIEGPPLRVQMPREYQEQYLAAYKDVFEFSKMHALERVAIEAMLHSEDTKAFLRQRLEQGWTLNFFSQLVNQARGEEVEHAIFAQLENVLREVGARRIGIINGNTSARQREEIQKKINRGNLDALINQWRRTSEGFAEFAGDRPVTIIPLRSSFSPGRKIQMVGRSYRKGQRAPVEYAELHAHDDGLIRRIEEFVHARALEKGQVVRTTWEPSLFHEDAYRIRMGKERKITTLFTQRSHTVFETSENNIGDSGFGQYGKLLSSSRVLGLSDREKSSFGSGIRQVGFFVGSDYEDGLRSGENAEPLGQDYNRPDTLLYAPGKINMFLAEAVERIKERAGAKGASWRIADLGSCSSAVFAQARTVYQLLSGNRAADLDRITSVDGQPGFIRTAQRFIEEKSWIPAILRLQSTAFLASEMPRVQERLMEHDCRDHLDFMVANFTKDGFGARYDVVITSQCLQYNDQTSNRDIERIVMNVNRGLRDGGHYLSVLTGNSFKKPFTTLQDLTSFLAILEAYGFRVECAEHLKGLYGKEDVLKPFHYIRATKIRDHGTALADCEAWPMYSPEYIMLFGGRRKESFRRTLSKSERTISAMPNAYVDSKGKVFTP